MWHNLITNLHRYLTELNLRVWLAGRTMVGVDPSETQLFPSVYCCWYCLIHKGVFFKEEETLRAIPVLLNPVVLVSRLPKALFRELSGRCSYQKSLDGDHQINPYGFSQGPIVWNTRFGLIEVTVGFQLRPEPPHASLVRKRISWFTTDVSSTSRFACWPPGGIVEPFPWTNWLSIEMNSISRILREKPIGNLISLSPLSKGSRADAIGFREGRPGRCEKPDRQVSWNRQRCYKVHPYWTNNLKYVA